jgi:hypothetical protein
MLAATIELLGADMGSVESPTIATLLETYKPAMAPPLPATLVHCAVFSTSSALVASAVLDLARQLVNTAGSLPARPFLLSSRCRGGERSGQAARHDSRRAAPGRNLTIIT